MYKDRIKKWGLEKKNKERDMVAILRKKTKREAIGKDTKFRVRGRIVKMEDVLHYFKRKKAMQKSEASVTSTPSDISCWTPSPVHTPRPLDNDTQMISIDHSSSEENSSGFLPLLPANNDTGAGAVVNRYTHAPSSVDNEDVSRSTIIDIYRILSEYSSIPHSPSPPRTLLAPDRLFFSIKTYFEGCCETGTWIINENGQCTTMTPATYELNCLNDSLIYCYMAADFAEYGSSLEFR
jgi:hypothetical protein